MFLDKLFKKNKSNQNKKNKIDLINKLEKIKGGLNKNSIYSLDDKLVNIKNILEGYNIDYENVNVDKINEYFEFIESHLSSTSNESNKLLLDYIQKILIGEHYIEDNSLMEMEQTKDSINKANKAICNLERLIQKERENAKYNKSINRIQLAYQNLRNEKMYKLKMMELKEIVENLNGKLQRQVAAINMNYKHAIYENNHMFDIDYSSEKLEELYNIDNEKKEELHTMNNNFEEMINKQNYYTGEEIYAKELEEQEVDLHDLPVVFDLENLEKNKTEEK